MTSDLEAQARSIAGLYAGLFEPEEYEHLIAAGYLRRSYEGVAGLLGVAKLVLTEEWQEPGA